MSNYAQHSFGSGEISPALYARTDQAKYAAALRTCRNFIVRPQGGVDNRPGTELVGQSFVSWLLPFIFNASQTYILEFSNLLLRFAKQGAYVGAPYALVTPYTSAEVAALQISQSADVVTIVHPSHPIMELRRLAETNWTLTPKVFGPTIAPPTNLVSTTGTPNNNHLFITWVVTAIAADGSESFQSNMVAVVASLLTPTSHTPQGLNWDIVAGSVGYNVYKRYLSVVTLPGTQGSFGFIGTTNALGFYDAGLTPDFAVQPPQVRTLFAVAGDYPAAVGNYQQRMLFAGSNNSPETVWTSRSADTRNFTVSVPTQDDDAITFTLVGKQVNRITHLLDAAAFVILSSGAAWDIGGDSSGIVRPTDINPHKFSSQGASALVPIDLDDRLLFTHANQPVVGAFVPQMYGRTKRLDLTLLAAHLFQGHTLVSWAYQSAPDAIVWLVRDDGVLLGLTYVPDQEILAWHHHDTDGLVECVCVIPENGADRLYLVVNRDGVRMLERMTSRFFTDIQDAIFTDATLSYDGRNADATRTMTLSGGTTWAYDELLSLSANFSAFSASEIGNEYILTGSDGAVVRFAVTTYTNPFLVGGHTDKTVPASLRGGGTVTWSRAVDQVGGLSHLEGKQVSVVADAYVVANPNNPKITNVCTVSGGSINLGGCYAYIHVGLPYVSDLETLDLDTPEGASLRDKKVLINRLTLELTAARGLFVGSTPPVADNVLEPLFELKLRDTEDYSQPVALLTGVARDNLQNNWNQDRNGRVFIRQVDPLPCTILAAIPTGNIPPASV